jgi:hypothetical protein
MDVSTFSVVTTHQRHIPAGARTDLRAIARVTVSGLDDQGADVSLHLWTPIGASLTRLSERSPAPGDLLAGATALDERTVACDAGRLTDGPREYELAITLPAGRSGDELLAARLGLVVAGETAVRTPIVVIWTDDERLLAAAIADLPTGPSPEPRHTVDVAAAAATSCPACALRAIDGDRFCERCGHDLATAQKW